MEVGGIDDDGPEDEGGGADEAGVVVVDLPTKFDAAVVVSFAFETAEAAAAAAAATAAVW